MNYAGSRWAKKMGRIRSIKPELFQHEGLGQLSLAHRWLFVGLLTEADRNGRLRDRPRLLKELLLPFDDYDCDVLLTDLANHPEQFIVRYEVDGKRYICIRTFCLHQRLNPKESPSVIPAPLCSNIRNNPGTIQELSESGKGIGLEGEGEGEREGRLERGARSQPTKRVPPDFALTNERRAFATGRGLEAMVVTEEWDKFRDHEFKTAHSDWDAAWRNWVRTAVRFRTSEVGISGPAPVPPLRLTYAECRICGESHRTNPDPEPCPGATATAAMGAGR